MKRNKFLSKLAARKYTIIVATLVIILGSILYVDIKNNIVKKEDAKIEQQTGKPKVRPNEANNRNLPDNTAKPEEILDGNAESIYGKWVNNEGDTLEFSAEGFYDYKVGDTKQEFIMTEIRADGGVSGYVKSTHDHEGESEEEHQGHDADMNITIFPAGVEGVGGDMSRDRVYYGPGSIEGKYFYYLEKTTTE